MFARRFIANDPGPIGNTRLRSGVLRKDVDPSCPYRTTARPVFTVG
jgi:hypothetical protein